MNKHAIEMEFLVSILVLLVVGIILLMTFGRLGKISAEHKTADMCKQTIETNAIGRIAGIPLYDEIKCATEYRTLDTTDEKEIKKEVADSLASCWYKTGAGQYELFDAALLSASGERTIQYCIICSVTEFDSAPQEITGFLNYLDENQAPAYYTKGEAMSYTEYLQGFKTDENLQLLYNQETNDVIDTQYDYATIFLYAKKDYINKVWSTVGGSALGVGAGIIGGALIIGGVTAPAGFGIIAGVIGATGGYALGAEKTADWESGVIIYPYETAELKKLDCDLLPAQQQNI